MSQQQRSSFFDILKGLLEFTVLGGHVIAAFRQGDAPPVIHAWWVMGAWGMPLFMSIAGWFFWYSIRKRSITALLLNKASLIIHPNEEALSPGELQEFHPCSANFSEERPA